MMVESAKTSVLRDQARYTSITMTVIYCVQRVGSA